MYQDNEPFDSVPEENGIPYTPSDSREAPQYQPPYNFPPSPKKKNGITGKLIAIALCCALLGGIFGAALTWLVGGTARQLAAGTTTALQGQRPSMVLEVESIDTSKVMTPAEVYATNVGSTVGITTSVTTNFWGYQTTSAASGSGFILTEDGYILTNHHVIENSNSISVAMYDGTSYDAELIGYDESNDIAVLKIDATGLTPVILGDSDNLNVGDSVIAIGNPLGELTFSLTQGVISAKDRQVTMSTGATMNLLQTDCSINSGNSGGALFNLYGEVIGVTNAKYSNNGSSSEASIENIGFAIPMNRVRSIVESIIEKGYFAKPYIGVSVTDVSQETQSYGLPQGAAVKAITEDSPAMEAGLQVNDIITSVNGSEITGSSDLVAIVGKAATGDKLVMQVFRQGVTVEITITVGEQIQSATQNTQPQQSQQSSQGIFPWGR